jgi:hypothetical protein
MNKEEVSRLAGECLTGVNRVIETLGALAPQGDALLTAGEMSNEDAAFFGRISSALSLLRACSNRLILLSTENGALSEIRVKHRGKLPTDPSTDPRSSTSAMERRARTRAKGGVAKWVLQRMAKLPRPISKSELVALGVTAGISDPALYHQINNLIGSGQILVNDQKQLLLASTNNPPTSL